MTINGKGHAICHLTFYQRPLTTRDDETTSSKWEMVNAELGTCSQDCAERSEGEEM